MQSLLPYVMRWIHLLSATLAVGVPIFMRFVLLPAAQATLTPELHQNLRQKLMARWRYWVAGLILMFLVSGLFTLFQVVDLKSKPPLYHMLFGAKLICALGIFFLASALAGRSRLLEPIRQNARLWLNIQILLSLLVIICSGIMRFLPNK